MSLTLTFDQFNWSLLNESINFFSFFCIWYRCLLNDYFKEEGFWQKLHVNVMGKSQVRGLWR